MAGLDRFRRAYIWEKKSCNRRSEPENNLNELNELNSPANPNIPLFRTR